MWTPASKAIACGAAALATTLVGCAVETSPESSGGSGGSWGGSSSSTNAGTASTQPMLVDVDTNVPLKVDGGKGVGVFTEYTAGGHWHVSWTCDTGASGLDCPFVVRITARTGSLSNVSGQLLQSMGQVSQPSADTVAVSTTTTTGIDGVTFDSAPGAIITVDAAMAGVRDGTIMFFVQDGVVNGGYTGALTDPLMFEPSTP